MCEGVNIGTGPCTLVVHNVGAKGFGGLVNIGTGPRTLVVHNIGAKGFGGLVNLGTGPRALVVHNVGAKGFGGLVLGLVHARLLSTASVRKALVQVQCFFLAGPPSKETWSYTGRTVSLNQLR